MGSGPERGGRPQMVCPSACSPTSGRGWMQLLLKRHNWVNRKSEARLEEKRSFALQGNSTATNTK